MPEQDPLDMPGFGNRAVELEDVTAAYAVYLGRRTDDPDQDGAWLRVQLSDLLEAFVRSPEFAQVQKDLIKYGKLPEPQILSAADLAHADQWLSRVTAEHRPAPGVEWADLLLSAVTSGDLKAVADPLFDSDALSVLQGDVGARRAARAPWLEIAAFDAAAFLLSDSHGRFRDATGGVDFRAEIARDVAAPVMLPLFTEGLDEIRGRSKLTVGEWLPATQRAAVAGWLTHWLWDEATYRQNLSLIERNLNHDAPDCPAYLDFLTVGDAAGVSPHPFFSHHAYIVLNGEAATTDRPAFRHFVYGREAAGLRTSALFDPDFYLARHPSVRDQIANGLFASALEHLVRVGLAAGYAFSPDFDRVFYLALYPDVAQAIAEGGVPSAEWHYIFLGAREGRAPNPFFDPRYYADRYPLIGEEMQHLGIATTIEHFLLVGRPRGWRANRPLVDRPVTAEDGKALFEKRARRAFGEIIDGAITIPVAETPRLSVIVPVSGQADFTAGALKSAAFAQETLKARRAVETEIIVIDNGSSDHTEALSAALPAVRVKRFAEPIGFPAAVNTGAKVARGDILLVINNDIEFPPDAFDRIIAALDDDQSIGVVGAKILLPNETLQEVGSMLDGLGSSHGLARGADAFDARGIRRVEVDYATACFIGFRREDFEALSGFDEAFSPGYFEDVDFSLRMKRDRGKRTVVDTGLAVTHYENASFAKGRPPGVNTALILRNRLRLKTNHALFFQGLDPGRPRQRARRARDAMVGQTRLLVLAHRLPAARRAGSESGRQEMIFKAFDELGIAVDMVALNPSNLIDGHENPRVKIFRAWMPEQSVEDVLRDHAGDYSHLWICGAANLTCHAGTVLRAKAEFGLMVICDTDPLASRQTVERMRVRGRLVEDDLALSLLADELAEPLDVDLWITADAHDRAMIERIGLGPVVEIGPSANPRDDEPAESASRWSQSDVVDGIRTVLARGNAGPD